ncbi:MAG: hypothetical protein M1817_002705 [Caeruleum heppii]|nr:MAG: hypothetical protein M1817_002705 [Caeruleum heppii]
MSAFQETPAEPSPAVPQTVEDGLPVVATDRILLLPGNVDSLVAVLKLERQFSIQTLAQQTKSHPERPITEDQHMKLRTLLRAVSNVTMTPELRARSQIDKAVKIIYDDQRFHFPQPYPDVARQIYESWEASNWGAGEVVDEEEEDAADAESTVQAGSSSTAAPATTTSKKTAKPKDKEPKEKVVRRPHPSHPIFGTQGIMSGILIVQGVTKSYCFDDTIARRTPKVFGHNGIAIGTCWPLQVAACRDGAHGSKMGGIAGNLASGAYSIVVAGKYSQLDADDGDSLHYSGSNAFTNEHPTTPLVSNATKALQRSVTTANPVRVIRSYSSDSAYRPIAGLRYDGLYTVVSSRVAKNLKGGAYLQFWLQRCGNQGPMDRGRPTRREAERFEMVQSGY